MDGRGTGEGERENIYIYLTAPFFNPWDYGVGRVFFPGRLSYDGWAGRLALGILGPVALGGER
jgi:hypothetical protein